MTGWDASSECEDLYKPSATDFTPTNTVEGYAADDNYHEAVQNTTHRNQDDTQNYFYSRLGFKVGEYFEGEKRLYESRK